MQHIRPIPIGIEFYKEMISEEYCYIDETLMEIERNDKYK